MCRELLQLPAEKVFWAAESDNTGNAVNVAGKLGLAEVRCMCHIYNLASSHLYFLVERTVKVQTVWWPHERAVGEVVDLCEKVRKVVKRFLNSEDHSRDLVKCFNALEMPKKALILDCSFHWDTTTHMLRGVCSVEAGLLADSALRPYSGSLFEADFHLARQVIGVNMTKGDASQSLQAPSACASQVLPLHFSIKAEYSGDGAVQIPCRGDVSKTVAVPVADLLAPAKALRRAILNDIEVNDRHLKESMDTLLKATLVDPRFRLAAVASFIPGDEQNRVKELVLEEIYALGACFSIRRQSTLSHLFETVLTIARRKITHFFWCSMSSLAPTSPPRLPDPPPENSPCA